MCALAEACTPAMRLAARGVETVAIRRADRVSRYTRAVSLADSLQVTHHLASSRPHAAPDRHASLLLMCCVCHTLQSLFHLFRSAYHGLAGWYIITSKQKHGSCGEPYNLEVRAAQGAPRGKSGGRGQGGMFQGRRLLQHMHGLRQGWPRFSSTCESATAQAIPPSISSGLAKQANQ